MKNTLLFIYSTNILVRLLTVNMKNCLSPKNPKICDPILVTLLKIRPHFSQSGRENAAPSSGTSPLASYEEVPPLPPDLFTTATSFCSGGQSIHWLLFNSSLQRQRPLKRVPNCQNNLSTMASFFSDWWKSRVVMTLIGISRWWSIAASVFWLYSTYKMMLQ